MNITILANRDLASIIAINYLLQTAGQHQYSVWLSAKVGGNKQKPEALVNLAFFEQSLFNDIIFPAIALASQRNRLFKTFDGLVNSSICVSEITDVNSDESISAISKTEPDLIVSIRFGQILKSGVISIPKNGVLNLHSGRLPDYRGVMATFWAMLEKQNSIATTLHFIQDAKIDAGDIVAINSQSVDYTRSYLWNVISLYKQGIETVASTIGKIECGQDIERIKSNVSQGNYYSFPTQADLNHFIESGNKLFDLDEIKEFAELFMRENKPLN